ncbi:putative cAMP-dependent protein kinase, regulatory subunit [uncultured Desulfatiglans sp.]|uniref:Putative cAMP-dependent protein kinase, regulatory subunit n=1 Tax=Uncultured Desulfatiglans sp. TaxID=1748965 RepID=A0A653A2A2_UNCDX|nr:putative cAMP-dependent protein kinase, regulatory subunit [uncultured Desulfatiglans sp.]
MVSLDFLEEVEVFRGLDDDRLAALRSCCEEAEFKRGDELFGIGTDAKHLWAVEKGEVTLMGEPSKTAGSAAFPLSSLETSMIFGWSSMVPPYRHMHSAFCASRTCRAIRIESACVSKLFEEDPELGYRVMMRLLRSIGRRFHSLQEELVRRRGQDMLNQW